MRHVSEAASTALRRLEEKIANGLGSDIEPPCKFCFGTGMEILPDTELGTVISKVTREAVTPTGAGAKRCRCQYRAPVDEVANLLSLIPKRYEGVALSTLEPNPNLHAEQGTVIAFMKQNPTANYFFCGEADCGKSHFLWALYEQSVRDGRQVFATTLYKFIEQIKAGFADDQGLRMVDVLERLENPNNHYSIFIDDIDKARPTGFAGETFHNFIDAVYNYKHQLVVTSQLDPEREVKGRLSLMEHFENSNPSYGHAIVRRIVNDETAIFRMF